MIIGFDAKRAFNNASGLGNYARDHLRLCHEFFPDTALWLYTPKVDSDFQNFALDWANSKIILPGRGLSAISPSWWRSFGVVRTWRKNDQPDIFHGLSASLPAGIGNWSGKKIVTVHDLIFEKYPRWYARADKLIHRRKVKHAARAADVVVAISRETADDLVTFYNINPEKIKVIYQSCHPLFRDLGANLPAMPLHLPKKFALYVGTIEERKHLGELLEVVQRVGTLPLVVVGKQTRYLQQFQSLVQTLTSRGLLFFERPDMAELVTLYRNAKFLAYPSQSEGFGIPVIEALFSGIPVLAGNSPCLQEAGGEGAIYVNPLDINELESAFRSLASNDDLRNRLIKHGESHRKQFETKILAKAWGEVYFG
ncbi:MAG: glycosyltransferase family 4 protein [Cryomorphaceae bacterium]|nr:glycosyltransferase family 4 protein [Cryomorphaceae bacterium]